MREEDNSYKDRREFPRLSGQVYYRIGKSQALRQRVSNISLGGLRIYSDTRWDIGEKVDLELHFPNGFSGQGKARVVWIKELPPASGSSYDVGLEFLDLPEGVRKELAEALKA
jgi:Tfp pilus assembly protein PilZ